MPELTDMTDVVLIKIVNKCDFKSILTLRKVCRDLRNFIDDNKFETGLKHVGFELNWTKIEINLVDESRRKVIKHQDLKSAEVDLKAILMLQKSKFQKLIISSNIPYTSFLEGIEVALKAKPLQVNELIISVSDESDLLKVLPYLDPKNLKFLNVRGTVGFTELKMDRIMELDQFKMSNTISLGGFVVEKSVRDFFGFSAVNVKLRSVKMEDVMELKETFLTSPHMTHFSLQNTKITKEQMEKVYGPSPNEKWVFDHENDNKHGCSMELFGSNLVFDRVTVDIK